MGLFLYEFCNRKKQQQSSINKLITKIFNLSITWKDV